PPALDERLHRTGIIAPGRSRGWACVRLLRTRRPRAGARRRRMSAACARDRGYSGVARGTAHAGSSAVGGAIAAGVLGVPARPPAGELAAPEPRAVAIEVVSASPSPSSTQGGPPSGAPGESPAIRASSRRREPRAVTAPPREPHAARAVR